MILNYLVCPWWIYFRNTQYLTRYCYINSIYKYSYTICDLLHINNWYSNQIYWKPKSSSLSVGLLSVIGVQNSYIVSPLFNHLRVLYFCWNFVNHQRTSTRNVIAAEYKVSFFINDMQEHKLLIKFSFLLRLI